MSSLQSDWYLLGLACVTVRDRRRRSIWRQYGEYLMAPTFPAVGVLLSYVQWWLSSAGSDHSLLSLATDTWYISTDWRSTVLLVWPLYLILSLSQKIQSAQFLFSIFKQVLISIDNIIEMIQSHVPLHFLSGTPDDLQPGNDTHHHWWKVKLITGYSPLLSWSLRSYRISVTCYLSSHTSHLT